MSEYLTQHDQTSAGTHYSLAPSCREIAPMMDAARPRECSFDARYVDAHVDTRDTKCDPRISVPARAAGECMCGSCAPYSLGSRRVHVRFRTSYRRSTHECIACRLRVESPIRSIPAPCGRDSRLTVQSRAACGHVQVEL